MSALILEHESLLETAATLTAVLRDFDNRLLRRDVDHQQHRDFARRARSLSLQFEAVVQVIRLDLYPAAFSVIRTAMEHELIDELMMLGDRYKQVFGSVTDEQWDSLVAAYDERRPEASTIVYRPTRSSKGRVTIVRRGIFEEGAAVTDATISHLYFVMQQYSPFVGRPSDQSRFDDGLSTEERRRQWAADSKKVWETYLNWSSIKESLQLNNFFSDDQLFQLDVQYRFLSGFVHATEAAYQLAYPRGITHRPPPVYDHYSSELCLLYILAIGSDELTALLAMADREPRIEVDDKETVLGLIATARSQSAHLWYPRTDPHIFDRIQEVNRRVWREYRANGVLTTPERPEAILVNEVTYYDNPHERLVALHKSVTEMTTGVTYASPWNRPDVAHR